MIEGKIAGRTGKQIEAAKRAQTARLGQSGASGKRKRCKKGKSCGASCIAGFKVCLVDLPWASSNGLKTVSNMVQNSEKPSNRLSKLESVKDFEDKLSSTQGFYSLEVKSMHQYTGRLLGETVVPEGVWKLANLDYDDDKQRETFKRLRDKLFNHLGYGDDADEGRQIAKKAYRGIREFTGSYYEVIRNTQRGLVTGKLADKYRLLANAIEKFLAAPEVNKPEVEKFRGKTVSSHTLSAMIITADQKGSYSERALASWSTSLSIAKEFADKPSDRDNKVILRTVNKKGVPIEGISSVPSEYEILTPKTANYNYVGYSEIRVPTPYKDVFGNPKVEVYHIFDLEEI